MAIFKKNTSAQCLLALVLMAAVISSCDAFGQEGGCFMPFLQCDLDICRRDCNGLFAYCTPIGEFHHQCCCAPKKLSASVDKNSRP
ncbi:hypothetical protein CFC21_094948 [Triticum aestivum]|uniref:Knottin scorpion toxin-like domain-containing protein n=2 Tax=Triticum aestivum TaxID=4565 RepID=A0A9R1LPE5_WHEAT|nr:hypothetical protein CFC21_094948 [Triticum aestivum]